MPVIEVDNEKDCFRCKNLFAKTISFVPEEICPSCLINKKTIELQGDEKFPKWCPKRTEETK
jgi:hypothetical protein